jgi:hypothetical protein
MKRCLVLSLILLSRAAFAGPVNSADEKAVVTAEKQYADAMVKADAGALRRLLADDLSYTHSNALIETKDDVLKAITSGKTKYKSIDFKTSNIRQYGDTIITNHQMVFAQPDRTTNVYVSMVWVRQPDGWKLVQRQATRLPD